MDEIIPLRAGVWKLLLTPKALRPRVLKLVARLAEQTPLLVLDGGNNFNVFQIARAVHGRTEILEGIRVSRAFTCYQMLSLLETIKVSGETVLLLDFLATFCDESVSFLDRSRLLKTALFYIRRLSLDNGLLVVVHPSILPSSQTTQLIQNLVNESPEVFISDTTPNPPEPLRLF